jgi:hypothetical protein
VDDKGRRWRHGRDRCVERHRFAARLQEACVDLDDSTTACASAIETLGRDILSLIDKGSKDQALRCIKAMRKECLQGEEAPAFNEYVTVTINPSDPN